MNILLIALVLDAPAIVPLVIRPARQPIIPLRNGALYVHVPSGLTVRVRSHSIRKASVTHHSDLGATVFRSELRKATLAEVATYLGL